MDEEIVRKVRKIASDRGTTLSAIVRDYLEAVAESDAAARREHAAKFRETVDRLSRDMGPRTWTRDDLYDRPNAILRVGICVHSGSNFITTEGRRALSSSCVH